MTKPRKRRVLLLILILPSILAVLVLTHIFGIEGRAEHFAKKWLAENRPDTELVDISYLEIVTDGKRKHEITCKCYDTQYGFFYEQTFEKSGFRYVPAEDVPSRSYDTAVTFLTNADRLSEELAASGLPADVLCCPASDGWYLMALTEETDPDALADICARTAKHAAKFEIYNLNLLVSTELEHGALLAADKSAFWRACAFSLPQDGTEVAAALLHKKAADIGTGSGSSPAEIVAAAREEFPVGDGVVWYITPKNSSLSLRAVQFT